MFNFFNKKPTFGDMIDLWAEACVIKSKDLREVTIESKLTHLKALKLHCPLRTPLTHVKFAQIEEIKRVLRKTNSPKTTNMYLSMLKQFFRWSEKMEFIEKVPSIDNCPNRELKPVDFMTLENFDVFQKCTIEMMARPYHKSAEFNQRQNLWANRILAYTGIRLKELARLKWSDIDFENKMVTIKSAAYNKGKQRTIKMSPQAFDTFNTMPKFHRNHVYPFHGEGKFKHRNCINSILKQFDLPFKCYPTIFSPSFITWALSHNKMAIQEVSAYVGHEDIQTTAKYYTNKQAILDASADFIEKLDFNKSRKIA